MTKPNTKVMYGLTHDLDGSPIVRVPKVVKVQIGQPVGPEVGVYIDKDKNWRVLYTATDKKKYWAYAGPDKAHAQTAYANVMNTMGTQEQVTLPSGAKAPACAKRNYPNKLSYFTFSKQNGDGSYEPDWDTIEAHGHCPTEIDILFTDQEPFQAQYQMWAASELRCTGDGINAMRSVNLPQGFEVLAEKARKNHESMFPIVGGCKMRGCPYALPTKNGKGQEVAPACKPHGRLQFQLIGALRLGGTAQFDTTSFRSVSYLFSCIFTILRFTGNGDPTRGFLAGLPLKLKLSKFKHRLGNAYAVSVELREESIQALREKLVEAAQTFQQIMKVSDRPSQPTIPAARQITASSTMDAVQMSSEFYPDELPDETPATQQSPMATATATAEGKLAEKLKQAQQPPVAEAVLDAELVDVEEDGRPDDREYSDADESHPDAAPASAPAKSNVPTEEEMNAATLAAVEAEKKGKKK